MATDPHNPFSASSDQYNPYEVFPEIPGRIYCRLDQPRDTYEPFTLEVDPTDPCIGTEFRPVFDSIGEGATPDYRTLFYLDVDPDLVSEWSIKVNDCLKPHGRAVSSGGLGLAPEEKRVIKIISSEAITAVGAPHGTYKGQGVKIAIIEKVWDMSSLVLALYGIKLPNAMDQPCKGTEKFDQHTSHPGNVYGVLSAGVIADGSMMESICEEAEPIAITSAGEGCVENFPKAIRRAKVDLSPGDVLLLEVQSVKGGAIVPLELHPDPDVRAAIQEVVRYGVVVIEPMANGGISLDLEDSDNYLPAVEHHSFDPTVQFQKSPKDSGAILVAAANPLRGPTDPPYVLNTNWGARADLNAWGMGIEALHSDVALSDTSAAAAIIAGVAVAAQSAVKADGRRPLNSLEMRYYLKQGMPYTQGIGYMPNLQYFIDEVLLKNKIPFVKA